MLRASKRLTSSAIIQSSSDVASYGKIRGSVGKRWIHTTSPRFQYSPGPESSGSAVGTIVKVVGVTGVIVGMPLAYAAYDSKFRTTVEGYVPFLKPVLDKISPVTPPAPTPKPDAAKPKFDPSSPLSFTSGKPSPPKVEKRDVLLPSEAKKVEEKKPVSQIDRDLLLKNTDSKSPDVPVKPVVVEKSLGLAVPAAAVTVDKIIQVGGTDAISKPSVEHVDSKQKTSAKVADSETKIPASLEKVGRETLEKARGNFSDLSAFLRGRQLTPEDELLIEAVIDNTVDRLHAEFDDYIEDLESEHEWELQMQLKRQIAAHAGTVLDALKRQEIELEAHFQARLQRRLDEERQRFNLQVASALARVQGIEEAITGRSRTERLNQKSQYLWHASHAFYEAVKYGNLAGHTADERMVPLSKYVTLAKVFSDSHPFVLSILRAVPEEALMRGVLTEDALRDRFNTVRQSARRVAMITDQDNSLFRYFLSYIQSILIRDNQYDLAKVQELDTTTLDTFRLLATAHKSVQQGDLATAVRLVGQLQGEPRKVAQDWLKETRLHLETQQIAKLLLAHSSAVGLSTVSVDLGK